MRLPPGMFPPKFNRSTEVRCILREFVRFHAEPLCIQLDMTG